jgi:hypothetical protein
MRVHLLSEPHLARLESKRLGFTDDSQNRFVKATEGRALRPEDGIGAVIQRQHASRRVHGN